MQRIRTPKVKSYSQEPESQLSFQLLPGQKVRKGMTYQLVFGRPSEKVPSCP